jgi:decaprenylphospho-beta-D-erythro-pentofuranosid-2-ulose 2-reductase
LTVQNALGAGQSVLVLGGGSDIGLATVRRLVADRTRTVVLAARSPQRLAGVAAELRPAGATTVELVDWDADDTDTSVQVIDAVFDTYGDIDLVLVTAGVLGDESVTQRVPAEAVKVLHTNFVAAAAAILATVNRMRAQGHGTVVVLSSVAGERVRADNLVYGSSKAGLDGFCQGLADSLVGTGVRVLVVRPGFVTTSMTAHLQPRPMATTADAVAAAIVAGIRGNAPTVWAPGKLRPVMAAMRHLPRPVFRRLKA